MANSPSLANVAANAAADAVSDLLDNGYLRIYDGSKPADADTALSGQTLLAELRFAATASGAAVAGVVTWSTLTPDSSANATGTASWFRTLKADGTSAVYDGTVGVSASDLLIATVSIVAGTEIAQSSALTYTQAKA